MMIRCAIVALLLLVPGASLDAQTPAEGRRGAPGRAGAAQAGESDAVDVVSDAELEKRRREMHERIPPNQTP